MLLVRSLRPDRVLFAAAGFVSNALGRRFVEPPVLDLGETFADSSPAAPLVFVLSPGVDPTEALRKLAAEKGMGGRFFSVALGQGQVRGIEGGKTTWAYAYVRHNWRTPA
jgi:dynein heavy chain